MLKFDSIKTILFPLFAPLATVCGLFAAVALGAGIILAGGGSSVKTIAAGASAFAVLIAAGYFVLNLPLLILVRFAFIASFFFKGEINFLKINEAEDPSGLNISLTLISGLILLFYDLIFEENETEPEIIPIEFKFLFGGLLICSLISAIYGSGGLLGWFSVLSLITSMLAAYVIASHFGRRERISELVTAVAAGLVFTGAISLSQYVLDFPKAAFFGTGNEDEMLGTQSIVLSRVAAFLRTPTEMAWVISSLLPLVLSPLICAVKEFDRRHRILFAAAAVAGTVAIILSLARGSWFGTLAALGIVLIGGWLLLTPRERHARIAPAGATILVTILLFTPFAGRIYERLTADDEGSAAIRLPLIEVAERIIADNPLVGVGLNNYRDTMTKYDETGIFVSQVFPNPVHNMFAHVTAEVGIAGGIIFCLLIAAALFENWQTIRISDRLLSAVGLALFAGLTAFIISAVKEPGSLGSARPPMRTLFFLYGITLAVSRLRRQKNINTRF